MGRGSFASRGGGSGSGGGNVSNNPLVNGIVDTLNSSGFVRLTSRDRAQAVASISSSTDIGDSFSLNNGSPIVKTGANTWQNAGISLTTSEVLGMLVDGVNIGWKIKFKSK